MRFYNVVLGFTKKCQKKGHVTASAHFLGCEAAFEGTHGKGGGNRWSHRDGGTLGPGTPPAAPAVPHDA